MGPFPFLVTVQPRDLMGSPRPRNLYLNASMLVNWLMSVSVAAATKKSSFVTQAVIVPAVVVFVNIHGYDSRWV